MLSAGALAPSLVAEEGMITPTRFTVSAQHPTQPTVNAT